MQYYSFSIVGQEACPPDKEVRTTGVLTYEELSGEGARQHMYKIMDEGMKMMTPENKTQNQGLEMFEDYSLQTGFTAMAHEMVPLLDGFCFHNAANCPDCESGMVKQGGCFSCPACGFSACS